MSVIDRLLPQRVGKPIPRGIARNGPAVLSYGFRPFFLGAGCWAIVAMVLWTGAIGWGWPVGGSYGPIGWHAHEMVFGYAIAALAGFMLTAIPNWTGRFPLSGTPLLGLVLLWGAGRLAMLFPDVIGPVAAVVVDALFIPMLAFVAGREIIAGRNWKNLKILAALVLLASANIWHHIATLTGADSGYPRRLAIAALVMLIAIVGGRIVPSFTRNWLAQRKASLPAPFGTVDRLALIASGVAVLVWIVAPVSVATAVLSGLAALAQCIRLARWQGWATRGEPILFVLHVGYAFVPLGLFAVAAAALDWITQASAIHVLTVGAIGTMTLAVMTRASLGHTGRRIVASRAMACCYVFIVVAAVVRPLADLVTELYEPLLVSSGALWLAAFGAFIVACGPILVSPSVTKGATR